MSQSIPKGLTREHVLKSLADLDAGIMHPFGRPTKFEVVFEGKRYAPKAVIGIAFRHLSGDTLHHSKFSGGEAPGQANYELRRLGFEIDDKAHEREEKETDIIWSDEEVEVLVADYFDMLLLDLHGQDYNKAEHNRLLREQLDGRSKASVEFKHRNVSAALLKLGLPYIDGYKPARNFQRSLVASVQAYLESHSAISSTLEETTSVAPNNLPQFESWERLFEAPPEYTPFPVRTPEPWRSRSGRHIDFVRRDAANLRLGRLGEEFSLELERHRLRELGRDDLAMKVEWVSDTLGDGLGYDLLSFNETDDSEKFIEVKTTTQGKYFPFYVSANEVRCSEAIAPQFHLYRLFRFTQKPRLYVLHGALSELCSLEPMTYRATVGSGAKDQDE